MNTLSKEDALLFHKLMNSLLFYVNKKLNVIKNVNTLKEFLHNDIQETRPLRKKIFSEKCNFIDLYLQENPDSLNKEELTIIASWKKYKAGKFFIVKHAKEYSLFFNSDNQKAYGVKGITDSFEEKFDGYSPIMVDITLIPFREDLIYDGLFMPFNISFGGGMRKSLKSESEEAIREFGVITSLGHPIKKKESNDRELLLFYMKSFDNKIRYEDEIHKLKKKSRELESVYYQEEGKHFGKNFKKSIKDMDVTGHFAVLNNVIVASGITEKELNENASKIVPKDKIDWIYKFSI